MDDSITSGDILELTTTIVSSHVANNSVSVSDVPKLIQDVYETLSSVSAKEEAPAEEPRPEPAVSIRASIKPDYLVCLEDGKKLKMLKRHLSSQYGMTPDDYRKRWDLPSDYPMVAPNYAAQRSELAKNIGLGQSRKGKGKAKAAK